MTEPVKRMCQACWTAPAVKLTRTARGLPQWRCNGCLARLSASWIAPKDNFGRNSGKTKG